MNLEQFRDDSRAINPRHIRRDTTCCDWISPDGVHLFHERANSPWSPFQPATFRYWSETVYTDKTLADKEAEQYGASVEMCFYCDEKNPVWFLIFDDLDKAFVHAFEYWTRGQLNLKDENL